MARMKAAKPEVMERQKQLLNERYDLSDRPAKDVTMSGSKPIQEGVRAKLPKGVTWDQHTKDDRENRQNECSCSVISLLFWAWLWGIWGMLLGIPIIVIVKVVSQHVEQLQPLAELLGE